MEVTLEEQDRMRIEEPVSGTYKFLFAVGLVFLAIGIYMDATIILRYLDNHDLNALLALGFMGAIFTIIGIVMTSFTMRSSSVTFDKSLGRILMESKNIIPLKKHAIQISDITGLSYTEKITEASRESASEDLVYYYSITITAKRKDGEPVTLIHPNPETRRSSWIEKSRETARKVSKFMGIQLDETLVDYIHVINFKL